MRSRSPARFLLLLPALAAFAGITLGLTFALIGIWPGLLTHTSGWTCPATHPESVPVTDTYSSGDGSTTTNITLYCLNERGETVDAGILKPMLIPWAILSLVVLVLPAIALRNLLRNILRRIRSRSGASTTPGRSPSGTGPFSPPESGPPFPEP